MKSKCRRRRAVRRVQTWRKEEEEEEEEERPENLLLLREREMVEILPKWDIIMVLPIRGGLCPCSFGGSWAPSERFGFS